MKYRRSYKRPARKVARRPVYRRKKTTYRRKRIARIPRGPKKAPLGGFPNTKTVALRYVTTQAINTSSSNTVRVFRANSIFDPDFTGGGHQPMYRDQYALIYDDYRVNYATITMVAINTHIVNTAIPATLGATQYYALNERACRMWIVRDIQTADYSNSLNTMIEAGNKNLVWRYCPQNTSGRMPTLRMGCWPHTLHNTMKKDADLNSPQDTNPQKEAYFICGVTDLGDGSDPDSMTFQFIITYNVTFFNPKMNMTEN